VSGTITYLDAWFLWFSGQEVDPRLRLWFMSILWWGRAGKIAAFLGGLTVILDLIGPDRLRRWGRAGRTAWGQPIITAVVAVLTFLIPFVLGGLSGFAWLVPVFMIGAGLLGYWIATRLVGWLADTLDRPTPAFSIRMAAAVLIAVGFHFDLLAS
jgi:hypothetical protein